jgi:hypothetical protein
MKLLKLLAIVFFFALMATQGARAEDVAPPADAPQAGNFFASMDGAVREVGRRAGRSLSDTMKGSGYSIAATLTPTALQIAGGLGLIYLFFEIMQFLSGRTKSMLTVLFDVGIPCLFAAAFITQYAILLPKFEQILDIFRTMGTHAEGAGSDPFEGILNVYTSVFHVITAAIQKAFGAGLSVAKLFTNPSQFMINWADLLGTILFCLAILVLLMMGVAEVLGLLLIGPFLFAVGTAFGPIMIAGLVTPWTRDYFTKWLQFLVISAGLQGVINVIFTIANNLMKSVGVGSDASEPTAVALVITAILLLTINSMISQAPSIASALFPGHVGVSRSSGDAAKTAISKAGGGFKSGAKAGGKGTVATAKGAVSGAKMAKKFFGNLKS